MTIDPHTLKIIDVSGYSEKSALALQVAEDTILLRSKIIKQSFESIGAKAQEDAGLVVNRMRDKWVQARTVKL